MAGTGHEVGRSRGGKLGHVLHTDPSIYLKFDGRDPMS
jgi:hypothetical protein